MAIGSRHSDTRPSGQYTEGNRLLSIAFAELGLGLKPELQVAAQGTSVLFPKFVGARSNLLPRSAGGPTLPEPLSQFLDPRPKPLISRLVRNARRDAARLCNLAFQFEGILSVIHRASSAKYDGEDAEWFSGCRPGN